MVQAHGSGQRKDKTRMRKGQSHTPESKAKISLAQNNVATGSDSHSWRGGITQSSGYVKRLTPSHPRSDRNGYVLSHILIAEQALGKFLPPGAVIHHFNEDKTDNSNTNLVICQDTAYHFLLHIRQRVKAHGGDPDTDKVCSTCREAKPFSAFNKNALNSCGLGNNCRNCFNVIRRAWNKQRMLAVKEKTKPE